MENLVVTNIEMVLNSEVIFDIFQVVENNAIENNAQKMKLLMNV